MLMTPAHSVIPRMLRTGMPKRPSNEVASSGGNGEPPVSTARTLRISASPRSTFISADMTVGTAAISVAPNRSTTSQ
jgi:hypothetical protein